VIKLLCKFCEAEYLSSKNNGEDVAREVMDHIVQKHPTQGSEMKRRLETATMNIVKDYVIFQKEAL